MNLELNLQSLPSPSISEAWLRRPIAELLEIKTRNEKRWGAGGDSVVFENRKEKMRERLMEADNPEEALEKIKATEVGWQRLILSLYIESNGQPWLPTFDDRIASEILGSDGAVWNASRRRQAAALFFTRFSKLPALSYLAKQLCSAFSATSNDESVTTANWQRARNDIFQTDGPARIAKTAMPNETLEELIQRYTIPTKGEFAIQLRQLYLLEFLQRCAFGDEPEVLHEIEKERKKPALDSLLLGAAALRIMVSRVDTEGRGQWPEKWQTWLVRLGCDPSLGRATAEGAKWWGWATESELKLAVQGMIGMTLMSFFGFLDGTVSVPQWEKRRKFLELLFKDKKIIDARLVLNAYCMRRLPNKMQSNWNTANLTDTTENTCIIALRCTDEVYILEGTHKYALRAFHRTFPVIGFWERIHDEYADSALRIKPRDCPILIRHHNGDWMVDFYSELRSRFHVEWKRPSRLP
jgi:hypothetical protein